MERKHGVLNQGLTTEAEGQRRHWSNRKCDASKLGFPHAKEILRKISDNLVAFRPKTCGCSGLVNNMARLKTSII